ncbi:MAG TPA: nucleotidyltransferase domain-containing protein [Rhizomicrobium sp.]
MDKNTDVTAREVKTALERRFGERLAAVYVIGSRARGEHRPDSDLDVAVVLNDSATHARLLAAFGVHLVKTGDIGAPLGKFFNRVEHERLFAGYSGDAIDSGRTGELVAHAKSFLDAVRPLVKQRCTVNKR